MPASFPTLLYPCDVVFADTCSHVCPIPALATRFLRVVGPPLSYRVLSSTMTTVGKSTGTGAEGAADQQESTPTRVGHCVRRGKFLFSLVVGIFDLATDYAMAWDLLKKKEPLGTVALLATIAPHWVPGWIAGTLAFADNLFTDELDRKTPGSLFLHLLLLLTVPILGFFFGGFFLGCGLAVAFHVIRLGQPFGCVSGPPEGWKFDIHDNSNEYMGWLVELIIGFWISVVEDIPECIVATIVLSGGVGAGDVNIAMLSAAATIVNFIWGAVKVARAAAAHDIPLVALLTAHVVRKSVPGGKTGVRNARAAGRGRR
eukprot:TRINITY_DN50820_c0_g1_i1.p1 TRINITY_DN50820_c0_g1~~TRINITY_DN50820_c0_g1_i1.p1  ORF type:complete len:334 (+),score=35.52 TRINITY_DN50820_c0_g1_i1:60-1004(+)